MECKRNAIVLLSGGLDSTTVLGMAKSEGFNCYCLTFKYGQRHSIEAESAKKVAEVMGVIEHRFVEINLSDFGGSALTDKVVEIPKDRVNLKQTGSIPSTYVPARNIIFLSYALAWAEVLGVFDIFTGVNVIDYSGYPDCRPEFINAFEVMANYGTAGPTEHNKERYKIHTPIIKMTKGEIIQSGILLGVDYSQTHSCYDPDPQGRSCGHCDSCQLRLKGFAEAGREDLVEYK